MFKKSLPLHPDADRAGASCGATEGQSTYGGVRLTAGEEHLAWQYAEVERNAIPVIAREGDLTEPSAERAAGGGNPPARECAPQRAEAKNPQHHAVMDGSAAGRSSLGVVVTFLQKLKRGKLVRSALVASSGHLIGGLLLAVLTPALSRLYGPADFGILAIYMPLLSIVGVFGTWRYEAAIALPKDDRSSGNLIILCLILSGLLPLTLEIGVCLAGEWLSTFDFFVSMQPYRHLFELNLFAFGVYQTCTFWAVRRGAFKELACMRIFYSLAMGVVPILVGFFVAGAHGLLLGALTGYGCALILLVESLTHTPGLLSRVSLREICQVARQYQEFPLYSTLSTVLSRLGGLAPPLLLGYCYGLEIAGLYALAQRAVVTPLTALSNPASRVYFCEAARLRREGGKGLQRLLVRTTKRISLFILPPLLFAAMVAPLAFSIIFGPEWQEAGVFCRILVPVVFFQVIGVIVAPTLEVLERQKIYLATSALLAFISAGSIFLASYYQFSPRLALLVFALATTVGFFVMVAASWYFAGRTELLAGKSVEPSQERKVA